MAAAKTIKKSPAIIAIAALLLLVVFLPHLRELACEWTHNNAKNCLATFTIEDDDEDD